MFISMMSVTIVPLVAFQAMCTAYDALAKGKEEADRNRYTVKEFVGGAR